MKHLILKQIQERLEKRLQKLEASINDLQNQVLGSSHAMQSWSDTSRSQFRGVIAKLQPRAEKIKECLRKIAEIDTEKKYNSIEIGALIKTNDSWYFLGPAGVGAESIEINGISITTISIISPLGKNLKGKKQGQEINFNKERIKIEEII